MIECYWCAATRRTTKPGAFKAGWVLVAVYADDEAHDQFRWTCPGCREPAAARRWAPL